MGSLNPIEQALAALDAYNHQNLPTDPQQAARQQLAPFLEYQQYDPSAPNFRPAPYGQTVAEQQAAQNPGEIQFDEDSVQQAVGHLPPATPKSVPVMSPREQAYREGINPLDPAQAQYNEDRATQDMQKSALDATQAQQDAERDTQGHLADVYQRSYDDQARADQDYQTARSLAHQQADLETNQWLQDMQDQALKEPNPHRWFDNKSSFGKAMWALSLISGAFSQGISGGQLHNVALESAQREIQSDIDEQKRRLDRELSVLKTKGEVMQQRQMRNLTDLGDDHTMALGRLNALQQEYLARAAAPGKQQDAAALAKTQAWFDQQRQALATKKREEAIRVQEERLQRAQQMRIQQMTDARERAIAAGHDQTQLDIAGLQYDKALATAQAKAEAHKDETRISTKSGIKVIDDKTGLPVGDGSLYVSNHLKPEDVVTKIQSANDMTGALKDLEGAINEASTGSLAAKTAVKAQQALAKIQVAKAGGKLAKLSDKDMDVFTQTVTGLGSNTLADRLRTGYLKNDVLAAIGHARDSIKPELDADLAIYAPEGTHIDYSGIGVTPPEERAPSPDEQIAALGGTPKAQHVPTNPAELRKARERGEAPELTTSAGVPAQYQPVVQKLEEDVKDATPAHIKALAAAALDAVTPDPWAGKRGSEFAKNALIPAEVEDALKVANANEKRLVDYLVDEQQSNPQRQLVGADKVSLTPAHVKEVASTEFHLSNGVDADYVDDLMKTVEKRLKESK